MTITFCHQFKLGFKLLVVEQKNHCRPVNDTPQTLAFVG